MTPAEVDSLLAEMKRRAGQPADAEEPPILKEFRELAARDDGREFYMVNLLKFRRQALYPPGSPFSGDALAANDRYNRAVIPFVLKHGGVPLLDSRVPGRFIHPAGADDWDRVAMVRYRSRRDMLKMGVEIASNGIDVHKWAALEKSQILPVKPLVSLFLIRAAVAAFLLIVALLLQLLLGGLKFS